RRVPSSWRAPSASSSASTRPAARPDSIRSPRSATSEASGGKGPYVRRVAGPLVADGRPEREARLAGSQPVDPTGAARPQPPLDLGREPAADSTAARGRV